MSDNYLLLKWGSLKGYNTDNNAVLALLEQYFSLGVSVSVALQHDTPEQKQLLVQVINAHDGPITNDWSGESLTKEQAVDYVTNYR